MRSKEKYLIIAARFNDLVTRPLVSGAQDALERNGVQSTKTVWVPGAFELPVAAKRAAASGMYDAVICLGAVIKGDTPHFDFVAGQAASGIMKVSVDTGVPVVFGVLTTNTVEEALNRAGLKMGNKGAEAAVTAVELLDAIASIEKPSEREL